MARIVSRTVFACPTFIEILLIFRVSNNVFVVLVFVAHLNLISQRILCQQLTELVLAALDRGTNDVLVFEEFHEWG